jgi:uncharacterized protein (DUF2126 family)
MRTVVVVEPQEALERAFELAQAGEVAATELDAPVLMEDRALQPLDEAVGEGVPWLRPGVADSKLAAGLIEGPLERTSSVYPVLIEA